METMAIVWWVLLALTALALLLHWGRPNAVWGTATLGFLVGLIAAAILPGFDWWTVAKATIVATLIGTIIEWAPRLMGRSDS